jgi:hypothetical protein
MAKRTADKWNSLTWRYKQRLESFGITRERYLAGDSLAPARGHARTPEHPERFYKHPERYEDYTPKRDLTQFMGPAGIELVFRNVHAKILSGIASFDIGRFDVTAVWERIAAASPETRSLMYRYSLAEYRAVARRQDARDMPEKIVIDGEYVNPFWYH